MCVCSCLIFLYFVLVDYSKFILDILPAWLIVIFFWLSCTLIGARIDSWLAISQKFPLPVSLYFLLGSVCIMGILILLLFTHLFYSWLIVALILAGFALNIKFLKKIIQMISLTGGNAFHAVFWSVQSALIIFAASTPPYFYDSLMYQLMMPAQFLKHHGFIYFPDIFVSSFPMSMNLFFAIAMAFASDIAAQLLSSLFALMTCVAIAEFTHLYTDDNSRWWSMSIFITTPVVALAAILPVIDLALTFYSFMSFTMLFHYFRIQEKKLLYLSSLSAGIALGIKYTYIPYFALMLLGIIFIYQYRLSLKNKFSIFLRFSLLAGLVASPWYIKNLIIHGDPFYPYFSNLTQGKAEIAVQLISSPDVLELIKNYLYTPFLMHFKMMGAAGVLGYLFLAMLPWVIFTRRKKEPLFMFALIASIAGFIAFLFTVHFIRYFLPAIPFLSILYALSLSEDNRLSPRAGKYFAALFMCINIFILFQHANLFKVYDYSLGTQNRDEFLYTLVDYYKAARYLEKNAPADARILLVGEGRTYYFKQECFANYPDQTIIIEKWITRAGSLPNFINMLKKNQVQYVLFHYSEMQRISVNRAKFFTLEGSNKAILDEFLARNLESVYKDNVVSIFKIKFEEQTP